MDEIKAQFLYTAEQENHYDNQVERSKCDVEKYEVEIQELRDMMNDLRNSCALKYEGIINLKREKDSLVKEHRKIEMGLSENKVRRDAVQAQNVQLENLININNNEIRKVKDEIKDNEILQT